MTVAVCLSALRDKTWLQIESVRTQNTAPKAYIIHHHYHFSLSLLPLSFAPSLSPLLSLSLSLVLTCPWLKALVADQETGSAL